MKEFEVVCTYLNGCAGEAYPNISFEEVEAKDPMDYIRHKHPVDYDRFTRENVSQTQTILRFDNGCIRYIYEFNEL